MLWVWSAHQETCGGYIDGDGGDEATNKGAEVDKKSTINWAGGGGQWGGGADVGS